MKRLKYKNLSIRYKLIIIFIIIVTIPICIMSLYYMSYFNKSVLKNTLESYENSAERMSVEIISKLKEYTRTAVANRYSQVLVDFLNKPFYEDIEQYEAIAVVVNPIANEAVSVGNEIDFVIYHSNKTLNMSRFLRPVENYRAELLGDKEKNTFWYQEKIDGNYYIINSVKVADAGSISKAIGLMTTKIPFDEILAVTNANGQINHPVLILDENNSVIFTNTDFYISNDCEDGTTVTIDNKEYLKVGRDIRESSIGVNNWKMIYMAPVDMIKEQMTNILVKTIALIAVCFLLAFCVILIFSKTFQRRLKVLIAGMEKLKNGDMNTRIDISEDDEIGKLYEGFNHMARRLEMLIFDNYQSKIQLQSLEIDKQKLQNAEAQSKMLALQRQINPHYLFNTLESIRMKALINGDTEVSEIIKRFAYGYREVMKSANSTTSVKNELKLIKNFFIVIRFRFSDNMKLTIDLEDRRLLREQIPQFIIQPLVENAVYHGFENKNLSCEIKISLKRMNDFLEITVLDNGQGMTKTALADLMIGIKENDSKEFKNLSLKNIYSRLKLGYSDAFNFNIESEKDAYTKITISLPLKCDEAQVVEKDGHEYDE